MADSQPLDGTHSDTEYDDTIGPEEVTIEEKWLQAARNGREQTMKEMIQQMKENEISLDINCRGNQKSNRGWSALHLASYFGHLQIVHLLLQNNADVNIVNTVGDTALHRAAYTGRLETVRALIDHNADVSIINSEGQTPTEAAKNQEIRDLLKAAENHENIRRHEDFLSSVREGDMDCVQEMLKSNKKPDVNSTDQFGNTALHIAAQANQREMAVFLLQTGISVAKKNVHDQTAVDFAKTNEMKQILAVRPVTEFTLHPHRFEGILSKKARFVGFRPVWVVLERGVLSYFKNRGDASIGAHRKGMKYLDEAKLYIPEKSEKNSTDFMMHYSDGTSHTFMVNESDGQLSRERWITCLKEHISYSTHYIQQGASLPKDGDEVSVKTLRDALTNAQATQKILERKVDELKTSVKSTQTQPNDLLQSSYPNIVCQVEEISSLSREACTSLSQCLNLFSHQDEKRSLQLKEEIEKSRVLQEALHALATEHLELEQSIGGKKSPSRYYDTDDDEFYECDDMENEEILDSDANQLSSSSNSHLDAVSFKSVTMDNDLIPERSIHGRYRLPVPMFDRNDFSVWTILKQCIGKELSKITMPVVFNEPLDFLQRIAEYMEYGSLLTKACTCQDPVERLKYVSAFAVSALSSNWERIGKPFNPLLGETFELNRPDLGFKLIAEQVSHHPPISAFHVEASDYKFRGSIHPKLKFWGKSVEIHPKGVITLELVNFGECYTWSNVNCCVHNVIVGKIWIEHYGVMEVVNHKTKHKAVLNFKQGGWFGKDLHKVEGYIFDSGNVKCKALYGSWVQDMYAVDVDVYENFIKNSPSGTSPSHHAKANGASLQDGVPCKTSYDLQIPGQETIWVATPRPEHSDQYFSFTSYAMALNEITEDSAGYIPPTDARLRPDIRLLEEGNIEMAATEKNRLEEKQRYARKERKKRKEEWTPVWFTHGTSPVTGKEDWIFKRDYWEQDWKKCPDIF